MAEGAEKHLDNLPEDWGTRRIGDICNVVRGASPRPAGDPRYFGGEYVPWLTVASLTGIPRAQIEVKSTEGALTKEGAKRSRVLEAGTVIIANSGATLGVAKQLGITCCANDGIAALQNLSDGNKKFVIQFINTQTKRLRERVATGVGQPNLNTSLISKIQIPFPPPDEQEAIAEALSDVDALLTSIDAAIEKKRNVKTATMQRLLSGEERLPGFEKEWSEERFGNVVDLVTEKVSPKASDVNQFCIELEDIEQGTGSLEGRSRTSEKSSMKTRFRKGDVLFSKLRPYLEKYWLADRDGVCSTEIWVFRANDSDIRPRYLYQAVKTREFIQRANESHGTHMPRADWDVVRDYRFDLPSIEEQRGIVAVLSDMDAEIEAWEKRRAKMEAVKTGMMQELLTGETRLV